MSKKRILLVAVLVALITLISVGTAQTAEPKGLASMPDPIDPQSWQLQEDMTWDDLTPNPVIDWMKELNPDGIINPKAAGNKEPIKGALLLVDFWDRPFITSQPVGSDMLGYYLHNPDGSLQDTITHNPIIHVDKEELAKWMADFIGKPQAINHALSVDGYWRENSYGKWAIEVDAFGPYTLQGFEMEYGLDYTTWADYPPTFRRAASGSGSGRSMTSESVALARDNGVYLGDYDFFFILHAGYDESNAWLEFGPMQWASPKDVPYEYGPGAKMDQIEEILTAHPEYLLSLDSRGGYNQSTAIRDAAAQVRAGTFSEFKFPAADRTWAANYSWGNAAPTRYVPWTAWLYATAAWANSGSASVPRSPANGGGNVSKQYSQQGENNGMGTYAHEFGHILSHADNYENPWAITRSPRADYWDLMSRGDRNGPGGYHARWTVPGGLEADGIPSHMMMLSKKRANYYDQNDLLELTVAQLKAGTPVVANLVPRNIPLNNNKTAARPEGLYPQLEEYGLVSPNYYKALELTFDAANPDVATLQTSGWSWTAFRAGRMAVEVVQRTGYDSYCNDNGVLLSRLATGTGQTRAVVDSHLYDINMVDYYLNGEPVYYVIGHSAQLNDALFHAGKSFVDTGYYQGSMRQWEERAGRDIVSGNTVNEFYDPYNKLHFYILDKQVSAAKYGELISYQVGLLHDNGIPVGGRLIASLGEYEEADPGRVAVRWVNITNSGEATDIIRVGVDCNWGFTLLNDLYAIGAKETIQVPIYLQVPGDGTPKSLTVNISSESNSAKKTAVSDFAPILEIATVKAQANSTVDVTYSIKGNINGFTALSLDIPYDRAIYSPISVTAVPALDDMANGNIFVFNPSFGGNDLIRVAFASTTRVNNDGVLFTVKYKVEAVDCLDVSLGATVILAELNLTGDDFFALDLQVKNGLMLIGIPGDINGDGKITPEDAIILLQMYVGLIDWTPRALLWGDVNEDGIIDPVDAALILRMVVGG